MMSIAVDVGREIDPGANAVAIGDVLHFADASTPDAVVMSQGSHYDYRAQGWRLGHDHAHYLTDEGPLYFCGADYFTCSGAVR
jgi:hypothetical protein